MHSNAKPTPFDLGVGYERTENETDYLVTFTVLHDAYCYRKATSEVFLNFSASKYVYVNTI